MVMYVDSKASSKHPVVLDGGLGTGQYPPFRLHQGESEPTLPPQPPMVDPAIPPAPDPAGTRSVL